MPKQQKETEIYACDFETTVYEGQKNTLVWSAAYAQLYADNTGIFGNISDFIQHFENLAKFQNVKMYFHNLKFDGTFIIDYLLRNTMYTQALVKEDENVPDTWHFVDGFRDMANGSFKYSISSKGQWYTITIKSFNGGKIEIFDSLKLIPLALKEIGKSFKLKHQKLEMEYTGYRYPNCPRTKTEEEYILNDVLVLKEALEFMFEQGHDKMTIGSCCISEYKHIMINVKMLEKDEYNSLFPDLRGVKIPSQLQSANAEDFSRESYKGGWCYINPNMANRVINGGLTVDVNSLYPSVMHTDGDNPYPVGKPKIWVGDYIPDNCFKESFYFIVKLKTRFYLKKDFLPTIQIKNNACYKGTEWLTSSDYKAKDGKYYPDYCVRNSDGSLTRKQAIPTLTLTKTDYQLLNEHYELTDTEIIGGIIFRTQKGLFDDYINKYREIKLNSSGGIKQVAKLFLNNLYGKFATSDDSSFKTIEMQDGIMRYITTNAHNKNILYIPIGTAVTSYARDFTIRAAQKNYKHFCYADTDSLHLNCGQSELKGVKIHDKNFNSWKIENEWDKAIFVRQKTYIEHNVVCDGEKVIEPFYNIKCAGLSERSKNLLIMSLEGYSEESRINPNYSFTNEDMKKLNRREHLFVSEKRNITDFKVGIIIPSKLKPHIIEGGTLLMYEDYQMR